MNCIKKITYILGIVLVVGLLSCVKDGKPACDSQIKFVFRHNLLNVDAFHTQASEVELFLFDANDIFVTKLSGVVPDGLTDNTYRMPLPYDYTNVTKMVAWSGLNDNHYVIPRMTEGVSTIEDLKVVLSAEPDSEIDNDFDPLLWGYKEIPGGIRYSNETIEVPMMKNTNSMRVVLAPVPAKEFSIDVDDFKFVFSSPNGSYDHNNDCFDGIQRAYIPHFADNMPASRAEITTGVVEISTARLREENMNNMQIIHVPTGQAILDTDMTEFLKKLQLAQHGNYEFQEYLDREDHYGVVIFLDRINEGGGEYSYFSSSISINGWIIREQPVNE